MNDICRLCGDPIKLVGIYYEHIRKGPCHIAIPSDPFKLPDDKIRIKTLESAMQEFVNDYDHEGPIRRHKPKTYVEKFKLLLNEGK